jgi:hypothetical protein
MLPLGLLLPAGATVVSANAEITRVGSDQVTFGPGLGDRTVVRLSGTTDLDTEADVQVRAGLVTVTGRADRSLTIRFP